MAEGSRGGEIPCLGSDFGRTNFYNSQDGKDHWPIGSFVIIEKNQPWTNRVVGETDGLHFAQRINPRTLERDDAEGKIIYPKHVHKALRRYLGIENTPGAQRFPFNNTEDFALVRWIRGIGVPSSDGNDADADENRVRIRMDPDMREQQLTIDFRRNTVSLS